MINSQNFSKAVAKALQVNAAKPLLIEQGQLYTYEALDKYSTLIAAELDILGVGMGSRVILCCQRGVKLAAMMLACARVGAVYMPVDKSYPNARIELICQQFSHQLFITDTPAEFEFSHAIDLDKMWETVNLQQSGDHSFCCTTLPLIDDSLPLYVNFSSGSTGKPKAILVKRQGGL